MSRNVSSLFPREAAKNISAVPFTQVAAGSARRPDWALAAGESPELDMGSDAAAVVRDAELAEAHATGVQEGRARALAEVQQLRDRLESSVAQLAAVRDNVMQRSEEDLVDLALCIAEQLVSGDPEARARFTRNMATQALALLDKAETIRLRVHPNERGAVEIVIQNGGAEVARRVTIVDDISVGAGGVIAECDLGRIDASFMEALRNIERGMKPGATQLRLAAVGADT